MKQIAGFIIVILFIFACSTQKNVQVNKHDAETIIEDSTEYDVEMFDGKFEAWYQRYQSPALYRQQSYYESWNKQYVTMWNSKANSASGKFPFDPVVGFDPRYDYGFELNHKLFHYFMYVENVLNIRIMPGGPHFVQQEP